MDLVNSIVSSLVYDLIKTGARLTYQTVFGNFYGKEMKNRNPVYNEFLDEINEKKDLIEKEQTINNLLKSEKIIVTFEQELYNTAFAKRLDYVMYLMNQKQNLFYEKINLEYLGEWLGFKSVNELKRYYLYNEEPDYSFIDNIAEKLGINKKWLKYGINAKPFQSDLPYFNYAKEILQYEHDGDFIFAIKDCDTRQEILVIKRINEFKYVFFPKPIVFHSQVGATGASQLYSTYQFLKKISIERESDLHSVHFIPENVFNDLNEGKYYPGIIMNYSVQRNMNILYDFLDFAGEKSIENYKNWYGEEFVNAQRVIKQKIGISEIFK